MKLVYGSQAIKYWFPDFKREPNDIDIITDDENLAQESTKTVEFYYVPEFFNFFKNKDVNFLDADFLYTFKVSHLAWDINWEKHMKDAMFLKSKGCKVNDELYFLLYRKWEKLHGKKNVKMAVKNEDFFKGNIYRKYNHEELHERFKFYSRPLNERIRRNLESPLCSEDLWLELTQENKIKSALEELFVLTSERYLLVQNPMPLKFARVKMLKQMIVSTTSGWFNRFLIENFDELRTSEHDYFERKLNDIR